MLEPLLTDRVSALDTPAGKTIVDALEAQEGAMLQVAFLGPWHGLTGTDPAALAGKTPLWQGAALADLETPEGPALILALAYAGLH